MRIKLLDLMEDKGIDPQTKLIYDVINEIDMCREDVAIRLNKMDELMNQLKEMVQNDRPGMFIDPNPFDDEDGVVNGKKVNPMRISADGSHLRNKRRDNDLLNANLTRR